MDIKQFRYVLLLLLVMPGSQLWSQQMPTFTQYVFNNFLYNPAVAGTNNYYQIRTNTRVQWVGLPDHPITNFVSVYGPHPEKDMGFGGYLYNDVTGPTSRTGFNASYAYNIAIDEVTRLSGGLAVGIQQYKVDGSTLEMKDSDDPLNSSVFSQVVPDATIGFYLYSYNYHVGISTQQLLNNRLDFADVPDAGGVSKLKSHFYLSGGYRYIINREWAAEPTAMMKFVSGAPFQMDITAKGIYKNMVWGGLSYRTGDAISLLLGYIHEKQYYFGYSYDYSLSQIRTFNTGSHEITIGYKFNDIK